MTQVPWDLIVEGLERIVPEVIPTLANFLRAKGIDLGPMTPDISTDMDIVDAEIDAELAKKP